MEKITEKTSHRGEITMKFIKNKLYKCLDTWPGEFTRGKIYKCAEDSSNFVIVYKDDKGYANGWNGDKFILAHTKRVIREKLP